MPRQWLDPYVFKKRCTLKYLLLGQTHNTKNPLLTPRVKFVPEYYASGLLTNTFECRITKRWLNLSRKIAVDLIGKIFDIKTFKTNY